MRRVSPKWIHTNHSLLARSKRCVSAPFLHHPYTFLVLCLLAWQASLFTFVFAFLTLNTHFSSKIVTNTCMTRSTSSLLSATSVSTEVSMLCRGCAGSRAGKAPPPPRFSSLDPSHQLVESSLTTNCTANPTGNRTVDPSGGNLGDDEITGPGEMVRFCLRVDVC